MLLPLYCHTLLQFSHINSLFFVTFSSRKNQKWIQRHNKPCEIRAFVAWRVTGLHINYLYMSSLIKRSPTSWLDHQLIDNLISGSDWGDLKQSLPTSVLAICLPSLSVRETLCWVLNSFITRKAVSMQHVIASCSLFPLQHCH